MSVSTVSELRVNPRLQALKQKHEELAHRIDDAQKSLSTTDYYLNQLKKQKLIVKEKLYAEEREAIG